MDNHQKPIDLFADSKIERAKLYRETPIQLEKSFKYIDVPKQASGFTPMEEIKLEGLVAQNLASGKLPWWVMIVCWFIFGFSVFIMLSIMFSRVASADVSALVSFGAFLLFAVPFLMICWRGIRAKTIQKNK